MAKRYRSTRFDPGDLMPPDLKALGSVPFGPAQRARLNAWLSEAGWSRERMDIAELEGYLVALIAWPVGISPGAWLPPIWGERGWKVPTKISSQAQYEEFVSLIVGFMRDLDLQLSTHSQFESSVLRGLRGHQQSAGLHRWGRGFMGALTLGSQGLKWRSDTAGAAVRAIANATSSSAPSGREALERVVNAVYVLMGLRTSRGPLGALAAPVPLGSPAPAPAPEGKAARLARSRD